MPAESPIPAASFISAAIAPNSIDHFVLMMTSRRLRPLVATSMTLGKVIGNVVAQGQESEIQKLKLNWWLEEIQMTSNGEPRHPLSIELSNALEHKRWLNPLRTLVLGTLDDVGQAPFESLVACLAFCHHTAERQALVASVLPECEEVALGNARKMGVGICLTEVIFDQPDTRRCSSDSIATEDLAAIARDHFADVETVPAEQRHAQLSVYLQSRLYQRLLERLQIHGYHRERATKAPFALLWQAWREARRLMR